MQAQQLQSTLDKVTRLIAASAESDAAFDTAIEGVPWRVIDRLRDFLTNARTHGAAMRIATRNRETTLDEAAVTAAATRAEAAKHDEDSEEIEGDFRGARLESWQFDFIGPGGRVIGGRIGDDISDEVVAGWNREFTNRRVVALFSRSKVTTTSGRERITYELQKLDPVRS